MRLVTGAFCPGEIPFADLYHAGRTEAFAQGVCSPD
jgi:hypothetical protein